MGRTRTPPQPDAGVEITTAIGRAQIGRACERAATASRRGASRIRCEHTDDSLLQYVIEGPVRRLLQFDVRLTAGTPARIRTRITHAPTPCRRGPARTRSRGLLSYLAFCAALTDEVQLLDGKAGADMLGDGPPMVSGYGSTVLARPRRPGPSPTSAPSPSRRCVTLSCAQFRRSTRERRCPACRDLTQGIPVYDIPPPAPDPDAPASLVLT